MNNYTVLAKVLITELTSEELEYVLSDDYTFKFFPQVKESYSCGGISKKRMKEIENGTIDILNKVQSNELKEEIKRQFKTHSPT